MNNYSKSWSEEIQQRIFKSHLSYLNLEESPSKLEHQRNLEGLIAEYLALVPHTKKFVCPQIAMVLTSSITENPQFSAHKAAEAFECLEKYANNLLTNPWRKEYKSLKLYSGFFRHIIQSQLVGAGSIFQLMGYEMNGDTQMRLDGPVDPDRLARLALDCITAHVECQVMIQIFEKVQFKVSWMEIHKVRRMNICGLDEAVKLLLKLQDTKSSERFRNPKTELLVDIFDTNDHSDGFMYLPPPSQFSTSASKKPPSNKSVLEDHHRKQSLPESYKLLGGDENYSRSDYVQDSWGPPLNAHQGYGIYPPGGRYYGPSFYHHPHDPLMIPPPCPCQFCCHHDIPPPPPPPPTVYLCDGFKHMGLTSNGYSQNCKLHPTSPGKRDSVYDNVDPSPAHQENGGTKPKRKDFSQTRPESKVQTTSVATMTSPLIMNGTHSGNSNNGNKKSSVTTPSKTQLTTSTTTTILEKRWSCNSCTFLNKGDKSVCEVCGCSKLGPESTPLVMGGRECAQCTLVNDKAALECTACGNNLKDSPTYI